MATVDLTVRFLLLPQLRALRDEGYEVAAVSAPGPWADEVAAEGIRHIAWPHATRAWDPAEDARAFSSLLAILRRERFDVVHTHNPKPGILGRIAARVAGVPCVVNTVHGLYATPDDPARRKAAVLAVEWLAARFSDLELYQSEEDLRWARRTGVTPRRRSSLLGNGVDLGRFHHDAVSPERLAELRRELDLPPGAPVVGTVGRMVAEKGYRELFAAAHAARGRVPEARFVVVGASDAQKWDAVTSGEIAAAGDRVRVLGWREDVRDVLALFDVFVLASWREGVPRSAIEAAAMGKPLVLTDIRGCREVGRHGREALLVPPRDAGGLADAIVTLLEDEPLRRAIGRAARRRAEERFDERRVVERLLRAYREVLSAKGLRPPVPASGNVAIRRARPADAAAMVRLHRLAMPQAHLLRLGDRFMRRLYRALAEDPEGVALVGDRNGAVVGMATGVLSLRSFYRRFLLRHGPAAALAAAPRLVRPAVLRGVRESAAYPVMDRGLPDAEFTTLGVDPAARGGGLGGRLTAGVLEGLRDLGATEIKWYVAADNGPANRLYERMGYRLRGRLTVHGRTNNVWMHTWPSSPDSGSRSS
ncbi:MAG TPA: glycosyltransferase family 4 protein [Actinomycetota bacterium]|nr:glycosyltransferase family 4 protein [Actinomycetota bacterium]